MNPKDLPVYNKEDMMKFLQMQYQTLRKEIEESKAREAKILISGILGTPALAVVSEKYQQCFYFLPLIVIALALLFLSERHTVMRAGTYIRERIEPLFSSVCGWEYWLSCNVLVTAGGKTRTADKCSAAAFLILSIFYYIFASIMAIKTSLNKELFYFVKYYDLARGALVISYISVGVIFCVMTIVHLAYDTYKVNCKPDCPRSKHYEELHNMLNVDSFGEK